MKKRLYFNCEFRELETTHKALLKGASLVKQLEGLGITVEAIGIDNCYPSDESVVCVPANALKHTATEEVANKKAGLSQEDIDGALAEVEAEVEKRKAPKKEKAAKPAKAKAETAETEWPEPKSVSLKNAEQKNWTKQLQKSIAEDDCSANDISVCLRLHAAVHGLEVTKALLVSMGYTKPSDVPEDKATLLVSAFFANVDVPEEGDDDVSTEDEDEF